MAVTRGPLAESGPFRIDWEEDETQNNRVVPRRVPLLTTEQILRSANTTTAPVSAPSVSGGAAPRPTQPLGIQGIGTGAAGRPSASRVPSVDMQDVEAAVAGATAKLSASPTVTGEQFSSGVERIGEAARGEAGGNALTEALMGVVRGVNTAVYGALDAYGRPVRSLAKEISDIVEPDESFSFREFRSQAIDPSFSLGTWNFLDRLVGDLEIMPGKRGEELPFAIAERAKDIGVKTFDILLQAGAEAGADVTSFVTAGPVRYAGRSGRALLASRLAQEDALALVPSLENKLGDVYRLGYGALSETELATLTANNLIEPAGFRFAGRNIGGAETAAATTAGFGGARARLGDTRIGEAVSNFTTPRSLLPLREIARGKVDDPLQVAATLATYGVGRTARGAGRAFAQQVGADANDVLSDLFDSPFRATVHEAVENIDNPAVFASFSPEEQDLATRISGVFAGARDRANAVLQDFAARRGLDTAGIGDIDNYFFHTMTPDAVRFVAGKNKRTEGAQYRPVLSDLLEQSSSEFVEGAGPLRARKLVKGEKFLGETLRSGSVQEINDVWRKQTGLNFDLFETDAAEVVQSYIYSVSKQIERIRFMDELFAFGDKFVRPVIRETVSDPSLRAKAERVLSRWENARAAVVRRMSKEADKAATVGERAVLVASKLLDDRLESSVESERAAQFIVERLAGLSAEIDEAAEQAARMGATKALEFEVATAPIRSRIATLQQLIAGGAADQAAARMVLEQEFVRLFPDVDVPADVREVARQIVVARQADVPPPVVSAAVTAQMDPALVRTGLPQGEPQTVGAASKELVQQQRALEKARETMLDEVAKDPVARQYNQLVDAQSYLASQLDQARALGADADEWLTNVGPRYVQQIDEVTEALSERPVRGAAADEVALWVEKVRSTLDGLDAAAFPPESRDALERVLVQLFAGEADLARLEAVQNVTEGMLAKVADAQVGAAIADDVLAGWTVLENLGVQVSPEVMASLRAGVERMRDPAEWNKLIRAHNAYLRFMKAYAVATPGFTVRNALSAMFMNAVAGVDVQAMLDGVQFATRVLSNRRGVNAALDAVPASERQLYETAYEMFAGAGGGQVLDDAFPMIRGRASRAYNNAYTRAFRTFNENVELAVRMGMSLDSARKGFSVAEGSARIARYQFDYSDLSRLDEYAKLIIPFWIFASRNIQLQMVSQLLRPGLYRAYNRVRENDANEQDPLLSPWLRARDTISLGGGTYLNLDLPQVGVQEQIEMLSDPWRLASMMSPLARSGFEAWQERQFATDIPYSDRPSVAGVTDYPAVVLDQLLNLIRQPEDVVPSRDVEGRTLVSDYAQQTVGNVLPPVQQLQRILSPIVAGVGGEEAAEQFGGPTRYRSRDIGTTLGGYLGIPIVQLTPEQRASTARGLIRDINTAIRRLENVGVIPIEERD